MIMKTPEVANEGGLKGLSVEQIARLLGMETRDHSKIVERLTGPDKNEVIQALTKSKEIQESHADLSEQELLRKIEQEVEQIIEDVKARNGFKVNLRSRDSLEQPGRGLFSRARNGFKEFRQNHKTIWRTSLLLALGAALYFGHQYLPSWDEVISWTQKLRGDNAAVAANTGVGNPGFAAPPVTPGLTEGGVTPTTPSGPDSVTDLFDAINNPPPPNTPPMG